MELDKRTYKVKSPVVNFFCPLCGVERSLRYQSRLSKNNWIQIVVISTLLMVCLFPFMKIKVMFIPLLVASIFEGLVKVFFKKEVPCPNCGFDATWYKRDVRKARAKVEEFWKDKELQGEEVSEVMATQHARREVSSQNFNATQSN